MSNIKCILVLFAILFLFYFMGLLVKKILRHKNDSLFNVILNGFIFTMAVFEILTLPFSIFKLNIETLYYITLVVYLVLIIFSIFINRKENLNPKIIKQKLKTSIDRIIYKYTNKGYNGKNRINYKKIILIILVIAIIGGQILISTYLNEQNADDAFYISWSQEAREFENYLETDPSTGLEDSNFSQMYRFNSWEIFNGFVARFFNIEVTILVHTIYIAIFILLSYMAYYLLISKIDKNKVVPMLLILSLIFIYSGFSDKFRGYALLMRIWQGKTILTNIFIPYVLYQMVDLHLNKNKIISLIITNIATIAFNPIAIWIYPFIYFFFAIIMFVKKQIKNMFRMIIVIIPYLLILPLYLKLAVSGGTEAITSISYIEYSDVLKNLIGNGYEFIIIYIFSFVYVITNGSKRAKNVFIYMPLIALATLLNPAIIKYVQKYITAAPVYWRIFWLIPFELTICYASVKFITNFKNIFLKFFLLLVICSLIMFSGTNMYLETGEFSEHINKEKIQQCIIDETNFILANSNGKVKVLAPEDPYHGATMRQLSSNIILLISRKFYLSNNEDEKRIIEVYEKIYSNNVEVQDIYNALDYYGLDYIIIDMCYRNCLNTLDDKKAKIVFEDDNYFIILNANSSRVNI